MVTKIKQKIINNKLVYSAIKLAKQLVLPGFEKMPLFDVAVFFINGLKRGSLTMRASALSYNFFLALFPFVIFLFTLIPYIPISNFQEELMAMIKQLMPKGAYEAVESTLEDIVKNQHSGLLSAGFISAMFFSTNGFMAMISAFNSSYHVQEDRSVLKQRLMAFLLMFITISLITIAIALNISSEIFLSRMINKNGLEYFLMNSGRWIISLLLLVSAFSFNYMLGPASHTKWKFLNPGSISASLLTILLSLGFAYYINNFGQYNKLYGSIGTLIVIMLWIYFNSLVILIGFELNASIYSAKRSQKN